MLYAGYPDADTKNIFIEETEDPKRIRCIDNTFTSRSSCVGYCIHYSHPGYLTKKIESIHKCHEKECAFFYYIKSEPKQPKEKAELVDENIVNQITKLTSAYEGMRIMNIEAEGDDKYKVTYISIAHYDLEHITKRIKLKTGKEIKMRRIDAEYDECVRLIFG